MYVLCAFVILNKDYLLTYLLKERLCKAATDFLHTVNFSDPFYIHVFASDYAVRAVVSQTDDKGTERSIVFASRQLRNKKNPTE